MIFVLQAGLYDLFLKKSMDVLGGNTYTYKNYLFSVINEDNNMRKTALSTTSIMASLLHKREDYLFNIASTLLKQQFQNPSFNFIINFPSFSAGEIVANIDKIKFANIKKYPLGNIIALPVCFSQNLFAQTINSIQQKVNININTLKNNFIKDLDYIKRAYKHKTIIEIDNLDYNLFEVLANHRDAFNI